MIGSEDASRNGPDAPPGLLNYASPSARRPIAFGGPFAIAALLAALFALFPLLITFTDGIAPKGRVTFLLFPIGAMLLGGIALSDQHAAPAARRRAWKAIFLGGGELALMFAAAGLVRGPSRQAERIGCATNLRSIGQSLNAYAQANSGVYPPSFEELLTVPGNSGPGLQPMDPRQFICPATEDRPASGSTAIALIGEFRRPGCCSYVYALGGIPLSSVTPKHILAYEAIGNHKDYAGRAIDGMNVVYADGHVEWVDRHYAPYLAAELQSGHNPPRPQPANYTSTLPSN